MQNFDNLKFPFKLYNLNIVFAIEIDEPSVLKYLTSLKVFTFYHDLADDE